jgi:hypothetical protein
MQAVIDSPTDLVVELDRLRAAIAAAVDLRQIKDLRQEAESARRFAASERLVLETQNLAAEVRLLAERRAGSIVRGMGLHGGDHKSSRRLERRLRKLGISPDESSRWQREALLPEEDFEEYLRRSREEGRAFTSRDVLDLARIHARPTRCRDTLFTRVAHGLRKFAAQGSRFRSIHVIPPWPEEPAAKTSLSRLVQELVDLPVEAVAGERAHLHLWTPPGLLHEGLRLVQAWGFDYSMSLVRLKPVADHSNYWQRAHDVLLLGVRGGLDFRDRSLMSWLDPRATSAVELLRETRSLIERASPEPYLEVFGGKATRGWSVLPS